MSITVLIVEDHQVTLEGLKSGLANQPDIEVVGAATTSDDGLDLAKKLRPDIILLDLHLPGSIGPKTMIQSFCNIAGSLVVIFSGENRMAFIQTVLGVGAAGYLLKSEPVSKVAETIRQVMAGKRFIVSKELIVGETKITKSEQEVLKLLARGMKYQDIADRRSTSPATARKQCELLLLKLGLTSREELIAWAVENGYEAYGIGQMSFWHNLFNKDKLTSLRRSRADRKKSVEPGTNLPETVDKSSGTAFAAEIEPGEEADTATTNESIIDRSTANAPKDSDAQQTTAPTVKIWQHLVENIESHYANSDEWLEPMSLTPSEPGLTFLRFWLGALVDSLTPSGPRLFRTTAAPIDESTTKQIFKNRSTRRMMILIFDYYRMLVSGFNDSFTKSLREKALEPRSAQQNSSLQKSLPITLTEPQEFMEAVSPEEKPISIRRFRVSTSSWALSVKSRDGEIQIYLLPSAEILRLSEGEMDTRLVLALTFDSKHSSEMLDIWNINGFPVEGTELQMLLKNLFRELIQRTSRQVRADTGADEIGQAGITDRLKELVLEKQNLALRMVMQQEEIQTRISRDLHDAVISDVMSLKRSLIGSNDTTDSAETNDKRPSSKQIIALLDQISQKLREICHDLAPRDLKDWGLQTVLDDLLNTIADRTGAECTLTCECDIPELPDAVELHIYRIIQECLHNIEKYAKATNVEITISCIEGFLTFEIRDNGVGFDLSELQARSSKEGGVGLGSLQERTDLLRSFFPAKLEIDSKPGKGSVTKLHLTLPS